MTEAGYLGNWEIGASCKRRDLRSMLDVTWVLSPPAWLAAKLDDVYKPGGKLNGKK